MDERIPLSTRMVAKRSIGYGMVKVGTVGYYVFGSDYVCGWDAGMFSVSELSGKGLCNHWTYEEMMSDWTPTGGEVDAKDAETVKKLIECERKALA